MKTNVETFCELFYLRGIKEAEKILIEAVRAVAVLKSFKDRKINIKDNDKDKETLFSEMEKLSQTLDIGHFPGDKHFFYSVYLRVEGLDLLKLLSQLYIYGNAGVLVTPEYLVNHFKSLIGKGEYILIAECEKFSDGIKNIIERCNDNNFTLTTENYTFYKLFETYFKDYKNVSVLNQSIYMELLLKEKYDKVFSIPNVGQKRVLEGAKSITNISETMALENLLKLINDKGKLIIVLPAKFTFAGGEMKELRRYLFCNLLLEEISSLPEGIFKPHISIKMNETIFSKQNKQVKISELTLTDNKLAVEKEIDFSNDEFKKKDDWNVKIHLTDNTPELVKYQSSEVEKIKLIKIAEIFRGKSILKDDVKPGNKYILNISSIEDGQVDLDNMDTTDEEERKLRRYQLEENDVLITCRGTINKVAIFPKTDKFVIASANVIAIRVKEKIMPLYLRIFLDSPAGKIIIKSFQRGTTLMNINPNDIKEMEVPLIDIEKQEELIKKYIEEYTSYKEELNKITKKWTDAKKEIFDKCI